MLSDLHIENIAVIERANISFAKGLNILTGETGAGKSIVIDALQAIMGARTTRELVRNGADKAVATAVFITDEAESWLIKNEFDSEEELILQRRISEEGKSSCRVCGSPVTAAQLRDLSRLLIDIHGQNDGRQLMDEARHREYLDGFGNYGEVAEDYGKKYAAYKAIKKEIKQFSMDETDKEHIAQRLKDTVSELSGAQLRDGEEAELSVRRDLLRNSEKLTESLKSAYEALYDGETCAISLAEEAAAETQRAARFAEELYGAKKAIDDAAFMLKDASEIIHDMLGSLNFSSEEYDSLETRIAFLRRLQKKYNCDEAGLIEKLEQSEKQLGEMEYAGDRLIKLKKLLSEQKAVLKEAAEELTKVRRAAAEVLQKRVEDELKALAMPSVRFLVNITPIENAEVFDASGGDEIRFIMSANAGEKPGPISKIASGGELSRIMLAMKNVFSQGDRVETLVFDEIDAGVSGIAAQRVGEKLAELSRHKQVICVTHLPQIAAMADTHFLIEKAERNGRTYTSVTELSEDGRAKELARLHGGDNITENTLISAKEQLEAANSFKKSL